MKPASITIVVRAEARELFDRLAVCRTDVSVRVMWDRRKGRERRTSTDPAVFNLRKGERRRQPPYTWDAADFIVVEDPGA